MKRMLIIDDTGNEKRVKNLLSKLEGYITFNAATSGDFAKERICLNVEKMDSGALKIAVESKGDIVLVEASEILYIHDSGIHRELILKYKPAIVSQNALVDLERKLSPAAFIRVKINMLLNLEHIKNIRFGSSPGITLSNGEDLAINTTTAMNLLGYFEKYDQ